MHNGSVAVFCLDIILVSKRDDWIEPENSKATNDEKNMKLVPRLVKLMPYNWNFNNSLLALVYSEQNT